MTPEISDADVAALGRIFLKFFVSDSHMGAFVWADDEGKASRLVVDGNVDLSVGEMELVKRVQKEVRGE